MNRDELFPLTASDVMMLTPQRDLTLDTLTSPPKTSLSPLMAKIVCRLLEKRFPWIGSDAPVDGSEVIQQIVDLHAEMGVRSREKP